MPLNFVWKVLDLDMYDLFASLKGAIQLARYTFAYKDDLNKGKMYKVCPVNTVDMVKLFRCEVGYEAKR